ncbi:hypothetical protein WMY93_001654 [Mugilogobius chulae]|uniref:Uncharacterized protein n=1 Tax=Mugilogobius chulae TaxID=88201 RepID=A0AAW0PR71_9GOBI
MDLWCVVVPCFLLFVFLVSDSFAANFPGTRYTYSRDALLQLNHVTLADLSQDPLLNDLDGDLDFLKRSFVKKRRKRGKRGGVKLRVRKRSLSRTPLPSVIFGNVQSLRNKLDELSGYVRFQKDFKECCMMAFTETWLTEQDQDADLRMDGFGAPFRLDRDAEATGKAQGGGQDCERAAGQVLVRTVFLSPAAANQRASNTAKTC